MTETTEQAMAVVEPVAWEVRPGDIEQTVFNDPESFFLRIVKTRWHGETAFVVSPRNNSMGYTRNGKLVYLRHDVNAKHARHATFAEAEGLARRIVEGDLKADGYIGWREAEERWQRRPDTN